LANALSTTRYKIRLKNNFRVAHFLRLMYELAEGLEPTTC
jgi:hypothetical protein